MSELKPQVGALVRPTRTFRRDGYGSTAYEHPRPINESHTLKIVGKDMQDKVWTCMTEGGDEWTFHQTNFVVIKAPQRYSTW